MQRRHKLLKHWFAALMMTAMVLGVTQAGLAQTNSGPESAAMRTLTYQGLITNGDKAVSDGLHMIVVTLYSDESGTTPIWSSTYSPNTKDGLFNLELGGSDHPLPDAAILDRPIWVGVRVDKATEMRPLTRLAATAYALNVADNSVTTSKLTDKAVTKEKIGADYVGSISINGQRVSGHGSDVNFVAGEGLQVTVDPATSTVLLAGGSATRASGGKGDKPEWIGFNPGTNVDGTGNAPPDVLNVIGGGDLNTANPMAPGSLTIPATPGYASILGGHNNTAGYNLPGGGGTGNQFASVGGGQHNTANATGGTVGGGEYNTAGVAALGATPDATVSGGDNNYAAGIEAAIPGGAWLKVGNNSFGFNNQSGLGALSDVSGFASPIGYFGNVDLHIGNTDNSARSLVLWGPNSSLNYTGGAFSTTLTAGSPTASIIYKLPTSAPTVGNNYLIGTTGGSPVQLSWAAGGGGSSAFNAIATGTNTTATMTVGTGAILQPSGFGVIQANSYSGTLPETNGGTHHGSTYTAGSVIFEDGTNTLSEDNTHFFYDGTNHKLGLGTTAPGEALDIKGNARIQENGAGTGKLELKSLTSGFTSSFTESTIASANIDYILPAALPTATTDVLTASNTTSPVTLVWQTPAGAGGGWSLTGNTPAAGNYLGTQAGATNPDLVIKTNGNLKATFQDATGALVMATDNGSGAVLGANIAQAGGYYKDNAPAAWGAIPGTAAAGGGTVTPFADFAVQSATWGAAVGLPANWCLVVVNVSSGFAFNSNTYGQQAQSAVTANVIEDCNSFEDTLAGSPYPVYGNMTGFCTVTEVFPPILTSTQCGYGPASPVPGPPKKTFIVKTYQLTTTPPMNLPIMPDPACVPPPAPIPCQVVALPAMTTMIPKPLPFTFALFGRH